MNNVKFLTLSLALLMVTAGCVQTKVQPPPVQQKPVYGSQSQITEEKIDPAGEDYFPTEKVTPQPMQQPVIESMPGQLTQAPAVVLPSID